MAREEFQAHSYVGVIALKLNLGYKFKYVLHANWFSGKLHLFIPWSKLNFPSLLKLEEWVWNVRSSKGHKEIKIMCLKGKVTVFEKESSYISNKKKGWLVWLILW